MHFRSGFFIQNVHMVCNFVAINEKPFFLHSGEKVNILRRFAT